MVKTITLAELQAQAATREAALDIADAAEYTESLRNKGTKRS